MDWGLRSPLYPAAAAAAAEGAAKALGNAGVFPPGDKVEWVWQDSACDADRVRDKTCYVGLWSWTAKSRGLL